MNLNKRKVAVVVGSFPSVSETFVINQIIDLIDRGYDVSVFAYSKNSLKVIHEKILDYKLLERTYYPDNMNLSKYLRYLDFFKFLLLNRNKINFARLLKAFNFFKPGRKVFALTTYTKHKWILDKSPFDIIHVHFGTVAVNIVEMRKKGYLANTGFITSFHGVDISPELLAHQPLLYKDLFKEVDLMTVNSEYTRLLLKKVSSSEKVKILPVGLNSSYFKKTENFSGSKFIALFVGRLIELKGPQVALNVIHELVKKGVKNIELKIVGDGEFRNKLESYIECNHLQENVKLLGTVSQERVKQLMEKSHILLLPGIYDKNGRAETQGLVIQEAQSMELPVIISDVGGMKYGMIDGETGFVVKENDIDAFATKIKFLMNNEDKRREMGKKGRAFVVKNYDSKVLGDKLEKAYLSIL